MTGQPLGRDGWRRGKRIAPFVLATVLLFASASPHPSSAKPAPPQPLAIAQEVNLDGVGHDRGSPGAPVEVVEFVDFACPHCATFATGTFPALDAEFVQAGRVRWKLVPLVLGTFRNSREAAEAAECAAEQGAFWPMHHRLFATRDDWVATRRPWDRFRTYAGDLGLEPIPFDACRRGRTARLRVERHGEIAARLGILGTPTFFVNGRRIVGAPPLPSFRRELADALALRRAARERRDVPVERLGRKPDSLRQREVRVKR